MSAPETVSHWLSKLQELSRPEAGGCPWVLTFPATESGPVAEGRTENDSVHVVFGFCVHGNEFGTLEAAHRLALELRSLETRELTVSLLIGNPEAALKGKRYLEEDLNRVFTFDRPAESLERRRAEELRPLLDQADLFVDFHQTQTDTDAAFWTLPWEGELGLWARAIGGAEVGLTRAPGGTFSEGRRCLDEYVRERQKPGLTLEVGTRGEDAGQVQRTYDAAKRALLVATEVLKRGGELQKQAENMPSVRWFRTAQIFTDQAEPYRLRPGLINWQEVTEGEVLSAPGAPLVRAREAGRILFPKYPGEAEPQPPELFRLGVPVGDPALVFATET